MGFILKDWILVEIILFIYLFQDSYQVMEN